MNDKPKIYAAMAAIMKETAAIAKGQRNKQQGFDYRGIDDVYNALHEVMAKHAVFCTPEALERTREERTNKNGTVLAFVQLRMKYTFWAEDGSSVFCIVEGEGMDAGDKATNKAMSVAHKYALLQCFLIPTSEQKDPDAESHEVVRHRHEPPPAAPPPPKRPVADIVAAIRDCPSVQQLRALYGEAKHACDGDQDLWLDVQTMLTDRSEELKKATA